MSERTEIDLRTQAVTALSEGDGKRQISATRRLESGKTLKISGLAIDYHPTTPERTIGAPDPQTGRARFNF